MQALIVIDMQNDFMPGGPLGTPGADELANLIHPMMGKFPLVLATKDWHPKDHVSFATSHSGKKVGDVVRVGEVDQILWPVHCVQDTKGSEFAEGLNTEKITKIFYKGADSEIDSYSAFYDNAHLRKTGLDAYLKEHEVDAIALVGVATDYCVLYSALDALELGYDVMVIRDACRAINLKPEDEKGAVEEMKKKGVKIVLAKEVF
ncbi:MAG: Peroxyureidoacrylate/ureidoacrylate amidohydrolase RutB [Chlamydiae bacterium]|nr:Peroxyureidoacrylate/ureidoacrylate amidohydrolase RutB [Chlamydiota bacterium]